jgi:DNA-binding NarL/FixJ family response regulator
MSLKPDVIVIDVNLPDGNGLDAAEQLRTELPASASSC